MIKRGNLSIRKILAIPQLFILILSMFAVSFIFSQTSFVTAGETQGVTGTASGAIGIKCANPVQFSSTNTGTITDKIIPSTPQINIGPGEAYTFSQKTIGPQVEYKLNGNVLDVKEAQTFAKSAGIDISKSADIAFKNSIQTS